MINRMFDEIAPSFYDIPVPEMERSIVRKLYHSKRELYALELLTRKGNWMKKLHAITYEPLIAIGVLKRDHEAEVYRVVDMRTNTVIWEAESARLGGTGARLELCGPVAAFISNYKDQLNRCATT